MSHQTTSRACIDFEANRHNLSTESGFNACISSGITTVIHVAVDQQVNYNCFNEPAAVSPNIGIYRDMHGLIFETSISLLAGSTRQLLPNRTRMSEQTATQELQAGYSTHKQQTEMEHPGSPCSPHVLLSSSLQMQIPGGFLPSAG